MFHIESFFDMLALITSCIGFIPQVYKSFVIKSASDISMLMLINYFICSISWVIYALYQYSAFVLISNVIGTAVSLISIAQKCYYDKRSV